MQQIAASRSIAISYLRILALACIVSCHFLQALGNRWAWVLNIGVQIFFFISGYLYGHKYVENWVDWFVRRIKRVYLPFIMAAGFWLILIGIFSKVKLSAVSIVSYVTDTQWFAGG